MKLKALLTIIAPLFVLSICIDIYLYGFFGIIRTFIVVAGSIMVGGLAGLIACYYGRQ